MIGEFLDGLFTAVTEFLKPVVCALENVIGAVAKCGAYVAEKTSDFIKAVDPNCKGICETLEEASVILNGIGDYLLGIGKDFEIQELRDCSAEELGARVLLPETREREPGEKASSYIDYLNTVDLNKEEFDNWSPEKKIASMAAGDALISEVIKEKTNVELPVDFILNMEKAEVKHEEVSAFIEAFNKEGKESMGELNEFFTNGPNMTEEKTEDMESVTTEALKELNPDMTDETATERVKEIKVAVQSQEPA